MKKARTRKVRKSRFINMRFRKNDPTHNLLAATQHYLKANGGYAVVIGGIQIITQWPGEMPGNYRVAVRCLGTPPTKSKPSAQEPAPPHGQ